MKEIIEYLSKAEGATVHRFKTEKDITAPYGIYKHVHPTAEIFTLLDDIALEVGVRTNSKKWAKVDIDKINAWIVKKPYQLDIELLAMKFYKEYLKDAHIDNFPKECKVAMLSMFTHSSKNAFKAVQSAINSFVKSKHINYLIQVVDGSYGAKTENGLIQIKLLADASPMYGFLFEAVMVFEMSRIYGKLTVKKPDEYLKFLNGWNNRVDKLLDMR